MFTMSISFCNKVRKTAVSRTRIYLISYCIASIFSSCPHARTCFHIKTSSYIYLTTHTQVKKIFLQLTLLLSFIHLCQFISLLTCTLMLLECICSCSCTCFFTVYLRFPISMKIFNSFNKPVSAL